MLVFFICLIKGANLGAAEAQAGVYVQPWGCAEGLLLSSMEESVAEMSQALDSLLCLSTEV